MAGVNTWLPWLVPAIVASVTAILVTVWQHGLPLGLQRRRLLQELEILEKTHDDMPALAPFREHVNQRLDVYRRWATGPERRLLIGAGYLFGFGIVAMVIAGLRGQLDFGEAEYWLSAALLYSGVGVFAYTRARYYPDTRSGVFIRRTWTFYVRLWQWVWRKPVDSTREAKSQADETAAG